MKLISLLSALSFVALALNAAPADAARTGVSLTITEITVIGTNARISFATGLTGTKAGCTSASRQNHFGINLGTNKGRALLSVATAALLSGKTVNVTGFDTCIAVDAATIDWQELNQLSIIS